MSGAAGATEETFFGETALYAEAPTGDADAIVFTHWYEEDPNASANGWRSEAGLAWKHALHRGDHGAMAVQGGLIWRSEPASGCGETGAELRWLGGRSFGREGRGFVNLEAAARVQEGGCPSQRLDITAGYRPAPNWLAMAQVFAEDEGGREPEVHGQITFVRFGPDGHGLQVGVRSRLDGGARESALVIGLWD